MNMPPPGWWLTDERLEPEPTRLGGCLGLAVAALVTLGVLVVVAGAWSLGSQLGW